MSCEAVSASAQPFFAALLRHLFPTRPLVVVTGGLKLQEGVHQDVSTWTQFLKPDPGRPRDEDFAPLFYPAWETLPHEAKLPHADVISERLETLVALTQHEAQNTHYVPLVITSVSALLQRTFRPEHIRERTRTFQRGDRIDPLDLIEWLEDQVVTDSGVSRSGRLAGAFDPR